MKISQHKIDIVLARKNTTLKALSNNGLYYNTLLRARRGGNLRPDTAGIIADALGVDITEILEDEVTSYPEWQKHKEGTQNDPN